MQTLLCLCLYYQILDFRFHVQSKRGHVGDSWQLWQVIPFDFRNTKTAGGDHKEDKWLKTEPFWLEQQACGDGIFSATGGRLSAKQTRCWEDERVVFSYCVSLSSVLFYKGRGQRMQTLRGNQILKRMIVCGSFLHETEKYCLKASGVGGIALLWHEMCKWLRASSRVHPRRLALALVLLFGSEISAARSRWLRDRPNAVSCTDL